MKCLFKSYSVLLMVAENENDSLDSEELQMQIDMCEDFLTKEEIEFLSEHSVLGKSADITILCNTLTERFLSKRATFSEQSLYDKRVR